MSFKSRGTTIILALFVIGGLPGIASAAQDRATTDANEYVPADAVLVHVPHADKNGEPTSLAATVSGPVSGEVGRDLAIIYRRKTGLVLRVVPASSGKGGALDSPLTGTFVASSPLSPNGISIRDLLHRRTQQILVTTSDGASLGLYLGIFAINEGRLEELVKGAPLQGHDFGFDCGLGSPCRVVAYGKWTDPATCSVAVFEWDGTGYFQTDRDEDSYFIRRLERLAERASLPEAMVVFARAAVANLAVTEYLARRDYRSAELICQSVLTRLQDTSLSIPRSANVRVGGAPADFQIDLREEKAIVHELFARCLEADGRTSEAEAERSLARDLRVARR